MNYLELTLADVKAKINLDKPLAYDSETIGFYGKIRLAQFYQRGWDMPVLVHNPNPFELAQMLEVSHVVCHNVHYDISTIQDQLGRVKWMPNKFDCTLMLSRLFFFKEEKFSLDEVTKYITGRNPYLTNDQQKSNWASPVLTEQQKQYAAEDVVNTLLVYEHCESSLNDYSYRLDMLTTKYCLNFQTIGMPINMATINEEIAKKQARIAEINLPINCNSYQQVRQYIGHSQSDDDALARLSLMGINRATEVREVRKLTKLLSYLTKYAKLAEDVDETDVGNIFGKFKLGPRSGRTSSDDENLQQIPRKLKHLFGFKQDGDKVLIYVDFAQIQLRNVCVLTGDKLMEKLFREGKDLHNFVASMIFGAEFTKEHRQISKTANFGLLFGAGVLVFVTQLISDSGVMISETRAAEIKAKWLSLWKQVAAWQKQGIRDWKAKRYWQTPLGRRYVARMMTDQLAMQIQGFEAEVAKLAMHYMMPKLYEQFPEVELVNFTHDSYMFKAPNDPAMYEAASKIIADAMQEAWVEMCKGVAIKDLPMPVKVRVGWNWGDIENDKFIVEYKQ